MMNPVEIIRKKRDGEILSRELLEQFVSGYVRGEIPDYQMSALLMAVYFRGMTPEETIAFAEVMLRSGTIVDLSGIPGRKVDKHSTGGVGDKVSLILAPMVAACGVPVPMISGRGLGHTGGTLDKLEAIPGFRTDFSVDEFRRILAEAGLALMGQTGEIVPADKRMYALRDVTATIESVPLIAGSIMSKKIAEGIDALVLDVKTGSGAFMPAYEQSLALARTLVAIGNGMGKETVGFITSMDQPLGHAVGNWLEVVESVECLRGKNIPDLLEVTVVLGGTMVWLGGKAQDITEGMARCREAIWSGRAYERFLTCVRLQGGDPSFIENVGTYPAPSLAREVRAARGGVVAGFDTRTIGMLAIELGAGRKQIGDRIDPGAGMTFARKIGDRVENRELLATVFGNTGGAVESVAKGISECIRLQDDPVALGPRIAAYVDRSGPHPWTTPVIH
jgi:pyrimidine-nucleoside phosphorylase